MTWSRVVLGAMGASHPCLLLRPLAAVSALEPARVARRHSSVTGPV
ncbi:hypothetical protein ACFFX0_27910 [Citricoccus parietis]|uniref:Uncharacterized protein n=1 Tax=Citricoccus parietis TaxID=592307 RepID=A0ABV5G797_9MICC